VGRWNVSKVPTTDILISRNRNGAATCKFRGLFPLRHTVHVNGCRRGMLEPAQRGLRMNRTGGHVGPPVADPYANANLRNQGAAMMVMAMPPAP